MANKGNKTDFTFTYKQVPKSEPYLKNFDKIKASKEISCKFEATKTKGGKVTYKCTS